MSTDAIHLLYFYDAGFAACTRVSLVTALEVTPGPVRVSLHPTEADAALEADIAAITRAFPEARLEIREVDLSPWRDLPPGRLPLAARARLLMPRLYTGRVLYFDGDTLIRKNLRPLWEEDLHGNCIGAALAPGVQVQIAQVTAGAMGAGKAREKLAKRVQALGGIDVERYFNNGIMLLDLDAIRAQGLDDAMADIDATTRFNHRDQHYMNALFHNETWLIDPTWNSGWGNPRTLASYVPPMVQARFRASREDPAILHYTGFEKPWHAPRPPFQIHLLTKPAERQARARWWGEFQQARARTEAILARALWP